MNRTFIRRSCLAGALAFALGGCGSPGVDNEFLLETSLRDSYNHSPVAVQTSPSNEAVDVGLDDEVAITFDRLVRPGTESILISAEGDSRSLSPSGSEVLIGERTVRLRLRDRLHHSKVYTVRVPSGSLRYLNNDAENEEVSFSFVTALYPPAEVSLGSPFAPGVVRTAVAVDSNVHINFDKRIGFASNSVLSLSKVGQPAAARIELTLAPSDLEPTIINSPEATLTLSEGTELVLDPVSDLEHGTEYELFFPAGSIMNQDDIPSEEFLVRFRTVYREPLIEAIEPSGNNVSVNANVLLRFNTAVFAEENIAFRLEDESGEAIDFRRNTSLSPNEVSIEPTSHLSPDTRYRLRIPGNAFRNTDQVFYALEVDYSFRTRPQLSVQGSSPMNQATGVLVGVAVALTFNTEVAIASNAQVQTAITFQDADSNDVPFAALVSGNDLTITPTQSLSSGTSYLVSVEEDLLRARNGVLRNGPIQTRFTTAYLPLSLGSTSPSGSAVDSNTAIVLTFNASAGMQSVVQNLITLEDPNGLFQAFDVSVEDFERVVIRPQNPLEPGQAYTLRASSNAFSNADGIVFAQDISFGFTIEFAPLRSPTLSPLGTGVPTNTALGLAFGADTGLRIREVAWLRLTNDASQQVVPVAAAVAANAITITPQTALGVGLTYNFSADANAIENGDGVAYDQLIGFSFRTAYNALSAPTTMPSGLQVATNSSIRIRFNSGTGVRVASPELISFQSQGSPLLHSSSVENGFEVVLEPDSALVPGASYSVSIPANAIENGDGVPYASSINYSFSTAYELLSVASTSPSGDTNPTNAAIEIVFNEGSGLQLDNQSGIGLADSGGNAIAISASVLDGHRVVLVPNSALTIGESYAVSAAQNTFKNGNDVFYAQSISYSFGVAYNGLMHVSSAPQGDQVAVGANITLTFNNDTGLGVRDPSLVRLRSGATDIPFALSVVNGNRVVLDPTSDFANGVTYSVFVPAGTLTNGNQVAYSDAVDFDFTTIYLSLASPTTTPVGTDIPTNTNAAVEFASGTGLRIHDPSRINLKTNGVVVPSSLLVLDGRRLEVQPTNPLSSGSLYTIEVLSGALRNGDGVPYAPLISETFRTSFLSIVLEGTEPEGTNNEATADIIVRFNSGTGLIVEDASRINFLDGTSNTLPSTASLQNGNELHIAPQNPLSLGGSYRVKVASRALKNGDGEFFDQDIVYDFSVRYMELTNLNANPSGNQIDVGDDAVLTFNSGTGLAVHDASAIRFRRGNQDVAYALSVSGSRLTLDPIQPLEAGTEYSVRVPAGSLRNGNGVLYNQSIDLDFRTAYVLLGVPMNSPTGSQTPPNNNIRMRFASGVGLRLVDTNAITVHSNGTPIPFNARVQGSDTLLITMNGGLSQGTHYDVFVGGGSLENGDGVPYQVDIAYDFTTTYSSLVLSTIEPTGSRNSTNSSAVITFNPNSGLAIHNYSGITIENNSGTSVPVSRSLSMDGLSVLVEPTSPFTLGETYTVRVQPNSLKNGDSVFYNPAIVYSFGVLYPEISVVASQPQSQGTDVPVGNNISLSFNSGTGFLITDTNLISLRQGTTDVPFVVSTGGDTVTINPNNNLEPGTSYNLYVPANTFENGDNIAYGQDVTVNFTTSYLDLAAPVSMSPTGNGIATTEVVRVRFGTNTGLAIADASRISLSSSGTPLVVTARIENGRDLVVEPDNGLLMGTTYSVEVLSGALANGDGTTYSANLNFQFRTVFALVALESTSPSGYQNPTNISVEIGFSQGSGMAVANLAGVTIEDGAGASVLFSTNLITNTFGRELLILTPNSQFSIGETYTVQVAPNAIENADSIPYAQAIGFSFGISYLELTNLSFGPTGTQVPIDTNIELTFNQGTGLNIPDASLLQISQGGDAVDFVASVVGGDEVELDPDMDLANGKVYNVLIPSSALVNGNNLAFAQELSFSFRTVYATISGVEEALPSGTGVATTDDIVVRFAEGTGVSIADLTGISISTNGTDLAINATIGTNETLQIEVVGGLVAGTTYSVSVAANAIQNGDGVLYTNAVAYVFTTAYEPLSLVSTAPSGSNIDVSDSLVLEFGGGLPVIIDDPNLLLLEGPGGPVACGVSVQNGNEIVVNPNANLDDGTTYTFTASTNAFKNTDDVFYAEEISFSFTTRFLSVNSPARFPTGSQVPTNTDVRLTFDPGTGISSDDFTVIAITGGGQSVGFAASVQSGNVVVLEPTADLEDGTTYTVSIPANTFQNGDGLFYNQVIVFSFTTLFPQLFLVEETPTGSGIAPTNPAVIIFNDGAGLAIEDATAIEITNSSGASVAASIRIDNGNELVIEPSATLENGETYTVSVPSNSLKNGDDVLYNQDLSYSFTTLYVPIAAPSISPTGGNVDLDANIVLTFASGTGLSITDVSRIRLQSSAGDATFAASIQNGNQILIDPDVDFSEGTTYTLSVAANTFENGDGILYGQGLTYSFVTTYPVLSAPVLSPANAAVQVNVDSDVEFQFASGVGLSLGDATNIVVQEGSTTINGYSLSVVGDRFVLDFNTPMDAGTVYTITVQPNTFANGDDVFYPQTIVLSFTTEYGLVAPPTISPGDATGISTAPTFSYIFGSGVGLATPNASGIRIVDSQGNSFNPVQVNVANGRVLGVTTGVLQLAESYTITIDPNTLQNGDGVFYNQSINHSFTTRVPSLSSPSLSPTGTGIATNADVEIEFNSGAGLVIASANQISFQSSGGPVGFASRIENGRTVVLEPSSVLSLGTVYTVFAASDTFANADGEFYNPSVSFSFTTDAPVPVLQSHSPTSGEVDVAIGLQSIELNFDRAVSAGGGSISVSGSSPITGADNKVISIGSVVFGSGGFVRIPLPSSLEAHNAFYTVSIPSGAFQSVYDTSVSSPAAAISFQFRTIDYFSRLSGSSNPLHSSSANFDSIPAFADLNNDGDLDLVVGERDGTLRYFRNGGSASSPSFTEITGVANPFDGIDVGDNASPALVRVDGDNDFDLVVANGAGEVFYYENIGTAFSPSFFYALGVPSPFDVVDTGATNAGFTADAPMGLGFGDLDGDGDLDLAVGYFESAGSYKVHYYRNRLDESHGDFQRFTSGNNPLQSLSLSGFANTTFADVDGDGDLDLFYGVHGGTDFFYHENVGSATSPSFGAAATGNQSVLSVGSLGNGLSPVFVDLDGDGDLDVVLGEEDGNLNTFRRN